MSTNVWQRFLTFSDFINCLKFASFIHGIFDFVDFIFSLATESNFRFLPGFWRKVRPCFGIECQSFDTRRLVQYVLNHFPKCLLPQLSSGGNWHISVSDKSESDCVSKYATACSTVRNLFDMLLYFSTTGIH
jgi:hypothetical protein